MEATGNWCWIVDEIEAAGCEPARVHPRTAKVMLGCINKIDKLDVDGISRLQRVGTLPTVWIPPGELRDLRELTRTRMALVCHRTRLKNRILATLSRYGRLRPDVNRYLKWAFIEAANAVSRQATRHPDRHISRLYLRIKKLKGHKKAVGAVAHHLAEATWHMLSNMSLIENQPPRGALHGNRSAERA